MGGEQREHPEEERESIWSIPAKYKGWYFGLFSVQFIVSAVWLIRASVTDDALPSISQKVFFVWQGMAPMSISSAAFSLVIVETWRVTMVIAAWMEEAMEKRRRRQIRRAADNARAEVQKAWLEWNERREAATAAGEDFSEPPPGTSEDSSES